jgi:teichuronic acid biosynthesis glycosyltransferase TuaG
MLFDTEKVNPEWLLVDTDRDFDFPDDLCAWLQVTKHGVEARGLDEVLAQYRKHEGSRSSALPRAVKRTWNQYRKIEGLSLPWAAHCLFWHAIHAVAKRL